MLALYVSTGTITVSFTSEPLKCVSLHLLFIGALSGFANAQQNTIEAMCQNSRRPLLYRMFVSPVNIFSKLQS